MAVTVEKLEKWAQKSKTSKIIKTLSVDNKDLRIAAIKTLGTTKDEVSMNELISLLKDPDVSIRTTAIEALGTMGNSRSLEFIRQLWDTEKDEQVRETIRLAINKIKKKMADEEANN